MRKIIAVGLITSGLFVSLNAIEVKAYSKVTDLTIKEVLVKTINEKKLLEKEVSRLYKQVESNKQEIEDLKNILINNQNKIIAEKVEKKKRDVVEVSFKERESFLVNKWSVNLRAAPSKKAKILNVIKFGTKVSMKRKIDNEWIELESGYFINSENLTKLEKSKIKTKKIANIRNRPFASDEFLVSRIEKNVELNVLGKVDNWYILEDENLIYIGSARKIK